MLIEELKSIEVLLRHAVNKSNLRTEILTSFNDEEEFSYHKNNLFNVISIDSILKNYPDKFPFSLENFLKTGIIPNMFEEKCNTPIIESDFKGDFRDFYHYLIKALEENNYTFDSDNNIHISSNILEASIPQIWLYRLDTATKTGTYERVFFYNKSKMSNIRNPESLVSYLRSTKSFITITSTSDPNADYELDYLATSNLIKGKLANQKEVKVEDIINLFYTHMPSTYTIKTKGYRLSNEINWIIKKVQKLGDTFYNEPLEVQEKILNNLIIEHTMGKEKSLEETRKFVLLSSLNNTYGLDSNNIKDYRVIIGLFDLYMNLLFKYKINISGIDFSKFKVNTYILETTLETKKQYKELSRLIVDEREKCSDIARKANRLLDEISSLDIIKDFDLINLKKEEREKLLLSYKKHEDNEKQYIEDRKRIDHQPSKTPPDKELRNEDLFNLIIQGINSGYVFINGNNIIVEIIDEDLNTTMLSISISIKELLEFIENINFNLENYTKKQG